MNIFFSLIDLIFQKTCISCYSRLENKEQILCSECEQSLDFLTGICEICGAPKENDSCEICESNEFFFDKACSIFHYNNIIQSLIHNLKYNEMRKISEYLGKYTKEYLSKFQPFSEINIITPIPLHRVKKRSRGFNQSEFLTKVISEQMNWTHIPNLILRKKFTETQTKLSRTKRQENVSNAFRLNPKFNIENKDILIVDDVFTTGATINSASNLLRNNGVNKIYVLTIARA